jgi:hypothetical protein
MSHRERAVSHVANWFAKTGAAEAAALAATPTIPGSIRRYVFSFV